MSGARAAGGLATGKGLPLLMNGDRMTQAEFHRRYEAYPDDTKFELVGGIVFRASPTWMPHGEYHLKLASLLSEYADETPGVQGGTETSTILGEESEPQPDILLRVREEHGGRSRINDREYLEGPPELLVEVTYSSRSIDLNDKRRDYQRAGVLEYLVLSIEDRRLFWFHFPTDSTITPDRRGICRSVVFPGLWIHEAALLDLDVGSLKKVLKQGLTSKAHRDFVRELQQRKRKS